MATDDEARDHSEGKDVPKKAFPCTYYSQRGMTLEDYFAAKALQGMLSRQWPATVGDEKIYARRALAIARTMMEEKEDKDK